MCLRRVYWITTPNSFAISNVTDATSIAARFARRSFDCWVRDEFKSLKSRKNSSTNNIVKVTHNPTPMEAYACQNLGPWIVNASWVHDSHFWTEICTECDYEISDPTILRGKIAEIYAQSQTPSVQFNSKASNKVVFTTDVKEKTINNGKEKVRVCLGAEEEAVCSG